MTDFLVSLALMAASIAALAFGLGVRGRRRRAGCGGGDCASEACASGACTDRQAGEMEDD